MLKLNSIMFTLLPRFVLPVRGGQPEPVCLPAGCYIDSRLERVNDSSLPLSM